MSKENVVSATADAVEPIEVILAGLKGMIVKFARETWNYIPAAHRRHICYEDVEQEALMRAWTAISTYDPERKGRSGRTSKLSTWVHNTLALTMREVNAPFTDPGRNAGRKGDVASIEDESGKLIVEPEHQLRPDTTIEALEAFNQAYGDSDSTTKQLLLDTLGFRTKIRLSTAPNSARTTALGVLTRCKLTEYDLRTLRTNEPERCLLMAAQHAKTASQEKSLPQIECIRCGKYFSVARVGDSIDAKTLVCSTCYKEQVALDNTCFAKEYDAENRQCSHQCPDRTVCAEVSIKGEFMGIKLVTDKSIKAAATKVAEEVDPFDDDETPVVNSKFTLGHDQTEETEPDTNDDEAEDEEVLDEVESDEPELVPATDDTDAEDEATFPNDDEEELTINTIADVHAAPATPTEPTKPLTSRQKEQATPVSKPQKLAPKAPTKAASAPKKAAPAKAVPVKVTPKPISATSAKPAVKGIKIVTTAAKVPAKAVKAAPIKTVVKSVKAAAAPAKAAPVKATAKPAKAAPVVKKPHVTPVKAKRILKPFKPQYWAGESPFRPGTQLQNIVDKLTADGGMKLDALQKHVEKVGLNWRGTRHTLAKGHNYNQQFAWKFEVTGEGKTATAHLHITKHPSAAFKKLCQPAPTKAA